MAQEHGLGRGLSSLIPQQSARDASAPQHPRQKSRHIQTEEIPADRPSDGGVQSVARSQIVANSHQPRLTFDKDKLEELAQSIAQHGILQPLVVTKTGKNQYELIAGERRFRASEIAGLSEVPVIVRDVDTQTKLELALIENIQRHDLNVIEEAKAYKQLMDEFGLSQEEVATRMGKSRSAVANRLRLLTLPVTILKALSNGEISEGHAKVILSVENKEAQHALFDAIVKDQLTVRQAETRAQILRNNFGVQKKERRTTHEKLPAISQAEQALTASLGTKVTITQRGKGGRIMIDYYAPEDLHALEEKLS
jgi:ParB family chromosome partitioning protein